jgi:hypothetical protein
VEAESIAAIKSWNNFLDFLMLPFFRPASRETASLVIFVQAAFTHFNEVHLHSALKLKSPRMYCMHRMHRMYRRGVALQALELDASYATVTLLVRMVVTQSTGWPGAAESRSLPPHWRACRQRR